MEPLELDISNDLIPVMEMLGRIEEKLGDGNPATKVLMDMDTAAERYDISKRYLQQILAVGEDLPRVVHIGRSVKLPVVEWDAFILSGAIENWIRKYMF